MKACLFALLALFAYAAANTIIERKLSLVSPLANTTCIYVMLLALSLPFLLFRDQLGLNIVFPDWWQILILLGCSVLFFVADLAWFQAYHVKGRIEQITATYLTFPLMVALMKGLSAGICPTRSDIVSWLIVSAGLIVSIKQPFR
jgi:drug/metabolite transporter (DMT)-like permease